MEHKFKQLLFSDFERVFSNKPSWFRIILRVFLNVNQGFTYMFWQRLGTFCLNNRKRYFFLKYFCFYMHRRYSRLYCLHIPIGTRIGERFSIGHAMCIVINEKTIIGNNVSIGQFVNIGTNHNKPAVIGDNVYIGPNVSVVENVKIGNNAIVGAGTVVVNDIPDYATSVGVPNRVVNYNQKI